MLFEAFKTVAASAPGRSGLRFRGETHPYHDLVGRIESAAATLLDRGIGPGARVALLLPNSPDLFVIANALFAIGAVAVPLSPMGTPRELAWAAESCGIGAIVMLPGAAAAADAIDPSNALPRLLATPEGLFAPRAPASLPPVAGDADAVYLFSSGSTGRPKVVPHSHAEMLANGTATAGGLKLTPDDVILNALPGHHAFGFMNAQIEVVAGGATTLYWSDPQPLLLSRGKLLAALAAEGVTVLPGVPFMLDTLAGATDAADLSRLRLVYSSGVGLRRPVYERFRDRFGINIRQAYGSTETGHIAFNGAADVDAVWDSVGRPVGDVRVDVLPSESATAPDTGELLVRSPALTRGYLNAEAANRAAFVDGGFLSGDLGRIDAAGNVYITGRSKLILEVAGHKIDPIEIEDVLAAHPAVTEAIVVGVPSPRTGEQRLKAVVVKSAEATADELLRHCRSLLSAHKVPELIEFRDEIPRSGAGKVLRGKLMED
jgi:acyl-CoA synthetase (AMP-forming)/AMP-acid ligase II